MAPFDPVFGIFLGTKTGLQLQTPHLGQKLYFTGETTPVVILAEVSPVENDMFSFGCSRVFISHIMSY